MSCGRGTASAGAAGAWAAGIVCAAAASASSGCGAAARGAAPAPCARASTAAISSASGWKRLWRRRFFDGAVASCVRAAAAAGCGCGSNRAAHSGCWAAGASGCADTPVGRRGIFALTLAVACEAAPAAAGGASATNSCCDPPPPGESRAEPADGTHKVEGTYGQRWFGRSDHVRLGIGPHSPAHAPRGQKPDAIQPQSAGDGHEGCMAPAAEPAPGSGSHRLRRERRLLDFECTATGSASTAAVAEAGATSTSRRGDGCKDLSSAGVWGGGAVCGPDTSGTARTANAAPPCCTAAEGSAAAAGAATACSAGVLAA